MTDNDNKIRHYWERQTDDDGTPSVAPGSDLAALRRGVGRDAGDVPAMWRYYTTLRHDGRQTRWLAAEHAALTLYAIHQQSKVRPMHVAGIGLGNAMRALRLSDKFSQDAVDRRFAAAATATSFREVCLHLRGLVTQLRSIDQPLDYTRLYTDLVSWQNPERIAAVRRTWGSQYFAEPRSGEPGDTPTDGPAAGRRASRPIPRQSTEASNPITVKESM